jgi:hypothetical protein
MANYVCSDALIDGKRPPHDAFYSQIGHTHAGGGAMEVHANEYHDPDMALASHNHNLNDLSEKSYNSLTDKPTIPAAIGYTLPVQALTSSPGDSATVYFGALPKAPTTTANISKVRIPKAGTIKRAYIYCYSGTAGTNESWSLNIRLNNLTDTLIKTLAVSASERIFDNDSLNISVAAGDYIEIKGVQPLWATNPLTTIYGGYLYIK